MFHRFHIKILFLFTKFSICIPNTCVRSRAAERSGGNQCGLLTCHVHINRNINEIFWGRNFLFNWLSKKGITNSLFFKEFLWMKKNKLTAFLLTAEGPSYFFNYLPKLTFLLSFWKATIVPDYNPKIFLPIGNIFVNIYWLKCW